MALRDHADSILELVASPKSAVKREDLSEFISARRNSLKSRLQAEPVSSLELAAALWAALMLDRPEEAKKMADTLDFLEAIETDPLMTTVKKARASIAVAVTHLASADLPQAMKASRLALDYSAEKGAHQEEAVAHSVMAAILALCGHYRTAKEHLATAKEIDKQSSSDNLTREEKQRFHAHWPRLFAELLIGAKQGGLEFATELAEIPLKPSLNGLVSGYRMYQTVAGQMIRGEFLAACSNCELYRSRLDYVDSPPLFNHLMLGAEALCLLQTERPGKVLSLLKDAESPPCRFVPYDLLLANAHILLGNPQKALDILETDSDVTTPQCVSARASALLREAVAREMLGDHRGADLAFCGLFHLADTEQGAVPPIGLPLPILETLSGRLAGSSPGILENLTTGSFSQFEQRDAQSPPGNCASLTPRELNLAEHLAAGKTFNEIAKETRRSPNTLKSQSSSLYKKLGVQSREEAISVLQKAGFFT